MTSTSRLLVNFFYAQPVGHAIEALHYALGHHEAGHDVSVALNAATPVELAHWAPFVTNAYAIEHPFVEPGNGSLDHIPCEWDWVLDDFRRHQDFQLELFKGMRDYYAASDAYFAGRRSVVGSREAGYVPHTHLRLRLPERVELDGTWIAVMPAGSSERALYPSLRSWRLILDALREAIPGVRFALIGKRTVTSFGEVDALLEYGIDVFDQPLSHQLATVEACDLFLAPHTGFGMAALAVDTPWLTLSGGRWFEYFFNHVPFRSVIPRDVPVFSQFDPPALTDDDGPRTPSMTFARFERDLDRIVASAQELLAGLDYRQALSDYFAELTSVHDGPIWSIDGIHLHVRGRSD